MKLLYPALILVLAKIAAATPINNQSFLVEDAYNQESRWVRSELVWRETWDEVDNKRVRRTELGFAQRWPLFGKNLELSYVIPYASTNESKVYKLSNSNASLKYQIFDDPDKTYSLALSGSLVYNRPIPSGIQSKHYYQETASRYGYHASLNMSMGPLSDFTTHINFGFGRFQESIASRSDFNRSIQLLSIYHNVYHFGFSEAYQVNNKFLVVMEWLSEIEKVDNPKYYFFDDNTLTFTTNILNPGLKYCIDISKASQMVLGLSAPIGMNHQSEDHGVFFNLSFDHKYW